MAIPHNHATARTFAPDSCCEATEPRYRYDVYGIVLATDAPLALPVASGDDPASIVCTTASAQVFETALSEIDPERASGWHRAITLCDGSTYVRWAGVGEFIVAADGRRIRCRKTDGASVESFAVYMLGQALSLALVRQGREPLHATAVVAGDNAVAFLGANGFGKSTLAAACLAAGCRLLTDDVLVLDPFRSPAIAFPGPPRIKLFAKTARQLGADFSAPTRMNRDTEKMVVPLDASRACPRPVPLSAVYALTAPADAARTPDIRVDRLGPRDAVVALVNAAFDRPSATAERLANQLRFMARVAGQLPVKRLTYPRSAADLHRVRQVVLDGLG